MKKLKSVILKAAMFVLIATLVFSGLNVAAYASSDSDILFNGLVAKRVEVGMGIELPDPLNGAIIGVKNPAGSEVEITLNSDRTISYTPADVMEIGMVGGVITVTNAQIGNYIITYKSGDKSYSFNVLSYEKKEYSINVIETADAFIPSFRAAWTSTSTATDKPLVLPKAELVYTNRKGETVKVKDLTAADIKVEGATLSTVDGKMQLTNLKAGLLTIAYETKLNANTTKLYRKVFNVNVQDGFANTAAPTLSVSSFSTTANVNTLVTLPAATARDSYDTNPFVQISVIGPDSKPVRVYEADENGYAIVPVDGSGNEILTDREDVVFNNNSQRSFYPTMVGKYRVTYTAINGEGVASAPFTSTIEVKDTLAPVITEIEETLIPSKWAINKVERLSEVTGTAIALENTTFHLPFPKVADNYSNIDDLTLTIRIANPASITVANWEAKISEFKKSGGKSLTSAYSKFFDTTSDSSIYNFTSNGMTFSFNYFDFGTTDAGSNDSETNTNLTGDSNRIGDWTITYSLRDEAGYGGSGNARKSYTVNVANSLTDIERPVVNENEVDLPEFILLGDVETAFNVPSIGVSDNNSNSRINVDYTISTDATVAANQQVEIDGITYDVKNSYQLPASASVGGQSWEYIQDADDNWYMLASKGNYEFLIKINDKIDITYAVRDHVGNVARPEDDDVEYYDYDEEQYFWTIDIMRSYNMTEQLLVTPQILTTPVEYVDKKGGDEVVAATTLRAGMRLNLGGFVVEGISADMLAHTGFELSILDSDNKNVPATVWSYFSTDENDSDYRVLTISDIVFTPTYESTYRLNVRFYNISGNSYAYSYAYDVEAAVDGSQNVGNTAAVLGTSGTINTSYKLESSYTKSGVPIANGIIVRKVTGRSFSLLGNTFVAHSPTSYSIRDYVYDLAVIRPQLGIGEFYFRSQDESTNEGTVEPKVSHEKNYVASFANNETPVIEVQGEMPIYLEKPESVENPEVYVEEQFVTLPIISGYTPYENAEVEVSVTFGGTSLAKKLYYQDGELVFNAKHTTTRADNTFSGIYAFAAAEDGDYTVTVTATTSTKSNTQTYTIKIGKRTSPVFNVENLQLTAATNDNFIMGKPVLETETGDELSVRIILRDPNNNSVYDQTFSQSTVAAADWYDNYAETSTIFEKSGNYELVYEVTNKAGLKTTRVYTVAVSAPGSGGGSNMTALTTILIILGILLIAGVIVYVVRFRAVKK